MSTSTTAGRQELVLLASQVRFRSGSNEFELIRF